MNDLQHLEATMEARFVAMDDALKIQAKEYERRLLDLNHEAARLKEMRAELVSNELYEANKRETNIKIEALQRVVYIATGAVLVLQLFLKFIIK